MKLIHKLLNERFAKSASGLLKWCCYFVMGFLLFCLILSCMGRQSFRLRTSTDGYDKAIYAEEDHSVGSRSLYVSSNDNIYVRANENDQIDLITHIALSFMYAFQTVPMFFAYWFLSRVFANIHKGQIFTERNALYLLYYGLIQFCVTLFVPFIKLLICCLSNLISSSQVSISTGHNLITNLFPSIVFLVAAYIIHYGIHLQDEVDHTL